MKAGDWLALVACVAVIVVNMYALSLVPVRWLKHLSYWGWAYFIAYLIYVA